MYRHLQAVEQIRKLFQLICEDVHDGLQAVPRADQVARPGISRCLQGKQLFPAWGTANQLVIIGVEGFGVVSS